MQPVVCNKDMAVVFPLKDGDCEFWLEIVDSVDDITNPSRDHAYVDSKGLFYIYNGKNIVAINDHSNLKIKLGNMIGDISNQLDLTEILNQFVKTISVNGTNIAKDNDKNIAIKVPITTIKLDGNTISPVDYIVNLDLASVYAKKDEIPKNVSELQNDAGYIKQEVVDQLIPIKAIKVNNVTILPDENRTVNIENVYVTPEEFGAIGDGTTDDSSAFNACIAKAVETGKYVLLSNKIYLISKALNKIANVNIIGINASIKVNNNKLTNDTDNCFFKGITFYREIDSTEKLIEHFYSSCFKSCYFKNIWFLFVDVKPKENNFTHVLLEDSYLLNTGISYNIKDIKEVNYIINNTHIILDNAAKLGSFILYGSIGDKIIFNNCSIIKNNTDNFNAMFATKDNLLFNNCEIQNNYTTFRAITSDNKSEKISFNNCVIKNTNNRNCFILIEESVEQMVTIQFINTQLDTNIIATTKNEFNLWLENCIMETKPIINDLSGKVNLVEIQQKYNTESENIFPWTTEPTPTVENNVSINSAGTGDYYVLTENEDKTIKKLDYYFKYTQLYTKGAPHYNTGQTFKGLDLTGYELKTYMLKNNIFKLKDDNGNLIDYVYMDLNSAGVSGGTAGTTHYTMINMQFIPAVTKWTGKEEANGKVDINTCITLILEKTSS